MWCNYLKKGVSTQIVVIQSLLSAILALVVSYSKMRAKRSISGGRVSVGMGRGAEVGVLSSISSPFLGGD